MLITDESVRTLLTSLFLASLAVGVVTDLRARRVPNTLVLWLLMIGAVSGIAHWSIANSAVDAILGVLLGLALWLPFWLLGMLGAGDVKYFAAAASWIGWSLTWRSALLAALLGGVMSVAVLVYRHGVQYTMRTVALQATNAGTVLAHADVGAGDAKFRTFPYALPMAMALAAAVLRPGLLLTP